MEWEFDISSAVVDAIPWLLIIAVDVCKPTDASSDYCLQVLAMVIEEDEVLLCTPSIFNKHVQSTNNQRNSHLFVINVGDGEWTVRLDARRGYRRPTVL